jgi:dTMP kinase
LCDRFYDSTLAYQGYGRQLDLKMVQTIIDVAVGETRPDLTLLLMAPIAVSEARRLERQASLLARPEKASQGPGGVPLEPRVPVRDRIEEADREFFERVERGYQAIAAAQPQRVRVIDGTQTVEAVSARIWELAAPLLEN